MGNHYRIAEDDIVAVACGFQGFDGKMLVEAAL